MAKWDHDDLCDKSDSALEYARRERARLGIAVAEPEPKTVLGTQVGGSHYTDCKIQPIEYIWANGLGFSEGNIVKYITRWKAKGGIKDLRKTAHHVALLIEEAERVERETGITYGLQGK